ncbi:MAG: N-acetylmuramoyl-L-alanine amidase [Puniceicoccales bacterium]|jgi:N-acetylmuramoyl-L-alanine amidase|nr:N-acetylmuramoyl-L-alanine amidase [Puniceicoccales bacterium]
MLKKWNKQNIIRNNKTNVFLGLSLFLYLSLSTFLGTVFWSCPKILETASSENKNLPQKTLTKKSSVIQAPKTDPKLTLLTINGNTYLSLKDIAQSLQSKILSNNGKGSATMTKGGATVQFDTKQDHIIYQNVPINLTDIPILNNKEIFIGYADYLSVLVPLLATNLVPGETPKLKTVVIDAGHGGKDSGAVNQRLNISEKTLTLKIAQLLQERLTKQQITVIMTRQTDIYKDLKDRSKDAANADAFLSIHINAAQNPSAHGVECYVHRLKDNFFENTKNNSSQKISQQWDIPLAYCVHSALQKETGLTDRGVKKANFAVFKKLPCPGVLVEIGFISNDNEASRLNNPTFQETIVQGIINGLKKYEENLIKTRQSKHKSIPTIAHKKQSTPEKTQKSQPQHNMQLILEKSHQAKTKNTSAQEKWLTKPRNIPTIPLETGTIKKK